MNLSHAYGTKPSEQEAGRLLNRALDLGLTLLDTAALYGGGRNEELLAKSVMHRRREFTLASKCVLDLVDGRRTLDGRPEAISASLDRSLRRLRTDHIDLYYLHRLDPDVPIEDSVGALVRAREAGKIGALGLSEMSAATLRRAHAIHPIAAMQSEYSPATRNPEILVLRTCAELGTGFVAFSPLARGLLSSDMSSQHLSQGDIRLDIPRFHPSNLPRNRAIARRFSAIAARTGMTPAQLSIAWCLTRGEHVVPIPGTRSIAHLEENAAAAATSISPEVVAEIDTLFREEPMTGLRWAPALAKQVDTERTEDEEAALARWSAGTSEGAT